MTPEQRERRRERERVLRAKPENREKARAWAREHYKKNKDRLKANSERWRQKNLQHVLALGRERQRKRRSDPDKRVALRATERASILRRWAADPKGCWLKGAVKAAKKRAALKGLPFDIDLSRVDVPDVCPVLGILLNFSRGTKGTSFLPDSPSLDRFVPSRGYVTDNVRVISNRANVVKRDATAEELERVLAYVKAGEKF